MPTPGLSLIVIKTLDILRLREFYSLLGVEFVEERHGSGPVHFAAQLGTTCFEVYPLSQGQREPDASTRLGFTLPQFEETLELLKQSGVEFVREPQPSPWGLRAVVRDPDGRSIELAELT